jgi:hypothetical protein
MAPSTPKSTAAKPSRPAKAEKPVKSAKATGGTEAGSAPVGKPAPAAKPAAVTVKLRDLIDSVASATGAKKPDAKASVEAVLAAIGAGLAAKSVLVVPPLGKLRVAKSNGSVLTLKLRLADASRAAGLALADDDEDS